MTSQDSTHADALVHRLFYVPWTDEVNNFVPGAELGRLVARDARLPLQVAVTVENQIPDLLKGVDFVTEKSSGHLGIQARVVVLLHPSLKLLSRALPRDSGSKAVVVEFPTVPLHGWAAANGAFNVATREVQAPLGAAEVKLYDRILWNGNNGWADAAGKRDALHDLRELRAMGLLDKDRLIGFMVSDKGFEAVARLVKLVDGVLGEQGFGVADGSFFLSGRRQCSSLRTLDSPKVVPTKTMT
ncbi:hypothetical protein E3O55_18950 [Cryobacterium sp. MDB1-18-2]|uniref:hypothetical protein n=1 Tax=unclassified Cryobacterium TaxID=2649013 RepID=UPI00106B21FD|nr:MULTISPECIES: hypothetical protein [unclassified Cryobacterium]TFC22097.1 hypothetical protein E3O55_18950 [Cryobacterium sp. MDB1-18-2]TFC40670.1 hypothetical protein E3O50_12745 [Cryobacterium sp. MDB1-18-1]